MYIKNITLLDENFKEFDVGHFPYDYSPFGEYHYIPPQGYRGAWVEPTNRGWRLGGHWLILEDGGNHFLEQTTNTGYHSMIVSGKDDWENYSILVTLQPLLESGETGVMFRYQSGRDHYALVFDQGKLLKLIKKNHETITILAEKEFIYDCDCKYEFLIELKGNTIHCSIDNTIQFKVTDDQYSYGKIGLIAQVPAAYYRVKVFTDKDTNTAYLQKMDKKERELLELRETYPKPLLYKVINTKGFGTGRHVRFGDLTGNGILDIVLAQSIKHHGIDLYSMITCLTAIDIDGNILWQFGEPRPDPDAGLTTSDVAFQIYDIDGDGHSEVICVKNFRIYLLNGQTGEVKKSIPTPKTPILTQETCTKWPESDFHRINGDCIQICNFSGKDRPSDILIKNRYNFVWAYDNDFNLLWRIKTNTGHFPQAYDFNNDGRDELIVGYTMFDADGNLMWDLGLDDHVDEIAIGSFNPALEGEQIAVTAGDEGFIIFTPSGKILHKELLGHAQRLTPAKFRNDLDGLQFYVVTFWNNPNIISFHDCTGKKLFFFEAPATGNILNPVNWRGDGLELALLSGSTQFGGMIDGYGRRVVLFPDDGHPEMCAESIDLIGDPRDEIILWDLERMYIYTQDRPFTGNKIYKPKRYPHYNNGNYRAEISLPGWVDTK